jgi:outer membrane protein insertion porin family
MKHRITKAIYTGIAALLWVSCSETKSLEPGQSLYDGASVHLKSDPPLSRSKRKNLETELKELLRPKPNGSFLGIKFKLLAYNFAGNPKKKGLRSLIRNKLGEPPVLASYSAFEKNRAVLQNRLENRGFFKDTVMLDTVSKKRKMRAIYRAQVKEQYIIRNVNFPNDSSVIGKQIARFKKRSFLKKGNPYDLEVIKNERSRIDGNLKQRGYYYFSADDLLMKVDSGVGGHQVDITLIIKRSTPEKAKEIYRINDVVVYADYDIIGTDTSAGIANIPKFHGYTIIDPKRKFKPEIFTRALVFKSGDLYNRTDHGLSLNRLISLGVFKFVKVRFDEPDSGEHQLNAFYYLTPTQKKSIRFEVSGLTKSDDANGGLLSVNWRNRNFFRGAELFTASIYGGLERQNLGGGVHLNTNKVGADLNLYLPGIVAPFVFRTNGGFIPKTRIELGYEFLNRTSQYTLNSFKTSYGYIWKGSVTTENQLNVLTINLVNPTHIDSQFQLQLDTNITLARSIERQFVIGPNYNFNYNSQLKPNQNKNNFYFNGNLDLSANLLGIITGADVAKGEQRKIFNTPFSQYIRAELDFRHYLRFSANTTLASRLTGGVGYAYGNSQTMPFIKEFFAGGANDIRAFRARSLGPGSYYAGNRDSAFLPDQPGDVKMEFNTELRFKLISIIHWAFFVDGGNIWTLKTDSSRPGSKISRDFLQQVAMGVGTGVRLDVSILILRLDLGIPIREPYLPQGSRWVFDTRNYVINFAIGYPF